MILVARREERLKKLAEELTHEHGIKVTVIPMDLAAPDAPEKLFDATQQQNLHVDVLINNAGILLRIIFRASLAFFSHESVLVFFRLLQSLLYFLAGFSLLQVFQCF